MVGLTHLYKEKTMQKSIIQLVEKVNKEYHKYTYMYANGEGLHIDNNKIVVKLRSTQGIYEWMLTENQFLKMITQTRKTFKTQGFSFTYHNLKELNND